MIYLFSCSINENVTQHYFQLSKALPDEISSIVWQYLFCLEPKPICCLGVLSRGPVQIFTPWNGSDVFWRMCRSVMWLYSPEAFCNAGVERSSVRLVYEHVCAIKDWSHFRKMKFEWLISGRSTYSFDNEKTLFQLKELPTWGNILPFSVHDHLLSRMHPEHVHCSSGT